MAQTTDGRSTRPDHFLPSTLLLEEAANWVIRLHYEAADDQTRQAFSTWLNQSPENARAWSRAANVLGTFERLPSEIGKRTLHASLKNRQRRALLRAVAMATVIAPTVWLGSRPSGWRTWTADARTTTGERRALVLADGSRIVLNTASAVDIDFTSAQRRLILQSGEVLITTAHEDAAVYRPFIVQTRQGTIQALGTRFIVHDLGQHTCVTVLEHAVQIQPDATHGMTLEAGQQVEFDAHQVGQTQRAATGAGLWEHGMFVATDMRLADVLRELERHRPGVLQCDPAVSDLRVTAAVSLEDTDAALAVLAQTLSLRIQQISRYWVMVKPA